MTNIGEYAFLWNGSEDGWALLRAPDLEGGYCIFNHRQNKLLHIDDEQLNLALCKHMESVGCEVLDDIPRTAPEVTVDPS